MTAALAATLNMAAGERSWKKSRESGIAAPVRELSWGCGTAKMEPAAGSPGPLIMNNKQPQPPPPPPPATAQPPPGAPRAGAGLLPGGKAREFNRNQRKDSEVRSLGGEASRRRGARARAALGSARSFPEGSAGPGSGVVISQRKGQHGRLAPRVGGVEPGPRPELRRQGEPPGACGCSFAPPAPELRPRPRSPSLRGAAPRPGSGAKSRWPACAPGGRAADPTPALSASGPAGARRCGRRVRRGGGRGAGRGP